SLLRDRAGGARPRRSIRALRHLRAHLERRGRARPRGRDQHGGDAPQLRGTGFVVLPREPHPFRVAAAHGHGRGAARRRGAGPGLPRRGGGRGHRRALEPRARRLTGYSPFGMTATASISTFMPGTGSSFTPTSVLA